MRTAWVTINRSDVAGGLSQFIESLEPADLKVIERAYRGLSGLHAVLTSLFAPPRPDRTPIDAAELNDLEDAVMRLEARVEELTALVTAQAERIAAQSEMLARRAERAAETAPLTVTLPEPIAERLVELANAQPESEATHLSAAAETSIERSEPESTSAPPLSSLPTGPAGANGKEHPKSAAAGLRRLEVAKLLAAEPLPPYAICEWLGIPGGSIGGLLAHDWFVKTDPSGRKTRYALTDAGRAALAQSGFVLVPGGETKPPEVETPAPEPATPEPEPETPDPAPHPDDPRAIAREQCRAIALAIADSPEKSLMREEIAAAVALDDDPENSASIVRNRLAAFGPESRGPAPRYFIKLPTGRWKLTNNGYDLARGEGAQQA